MTQHVRTSYRNHRRATWGLVIAVVVAIAAVLVPLASGAGGGRPTTFTFTGNASACAGTTSVTFNVVITNTSNSTQNLGSADLYAPTNLTVTGATIVAGGGASASIVTPIGTAQLNGETRSLIHVRNLQLPGGQTPKAAATIQVVANVSDPTVQKKSWYALAKQANDFNPGDTDLSNAFSFAGDQPYFEVAACELRFVAQPPNPWQKGAQATVSAAVYAGSTAVPSGGLNPSLGAKVAGADTDASSQFAVGARSYSGSPTFTWSWPTMPNSNAQSGLYNLVVSAGGYTAVKSDSNVAAGNQEAPFRVADFSCPVGPDPCDELSPASGNQAAGGVTLTNPFLTPIALDFEPGGTGYECVPWPNRASYTDASGTKYFPAVTLDYTWGEKLLKVTYRIRNSDWLLTEPAQGNQDIEFCAIARHQTVALNDGNHPFVGKYDVAFVDGFYVGVLATVSNPNKVATDGSGSPAVCQRGTTTDITGVTWRTWTICIPIDWDWGVKPG
jgi:hypothetical protein